MTSRRTVRIVFAAGLAAWLVNAAILWATGSMLGHDEAQYAVAAQDLLDGAPVRWNYLSVGMSLVAAPGVLAGGGELALRLVPALLGVGFLLVAAGLARAAFGGAAAAWTTAVLAASMCFARRAAELLSDLPAAALLLAGAALLVTELTRGEPSRSGEAAGEDRAKLVREAPPRPRLLLAAPCFAAAFYLRYGSVLPIGAIGAVALVVGWRAVLRRPWLALATIALFAALLVPFVWMSIAATGSPLGIFRESSGVLGDAYVGQSLVTYATANPFAYYGIATTPALLAGLASIYRGRDRRVLMLWLMAVASIVAVGLTPVAQSRYIFFGLALLVILGVDTIDRWVRARRPAARRVLGGFAAAALAASWLAVEIGAVRLSGARTERMTATVAAVAAIRDDARGAPCEVIGRHTTQLQWYTGCVAVLDVRLEELSRARVYVVQEIGGKYQPDLAGHPGVPRAILDRPGFLVVTRLDPPP